MQLVGHFIAAKGGTKYIFFHVHFFYGVMIPDADFKTEHAFELNAI